MTDQPDHDAARIRVAYHEAAHAVAAWRLGRDVLEVSIDPHGDRLGQVSHSMESWDGPAVADWFVPIRGGLRDIVETDILIALAGHIAEDFIEPRSGYGLRPDDDWSERAALVLATRSARHAELIARAERRGESPPIETQLSADGLFAKGQSLALAGQESAAHLSWMRAVTRRLVSESAHRIQRLAEAPLAEHSRVIDGERATAIIEGAEA